MRLAATHTGLSEDSFVNGRFRPLGPGPTGDAEARNLLEIRLKPAESNTFILLTVKYAQSSDPVVDYANVWLRATDAFSSCETTT